MKEGGHAAGKSPVIVVPIPTVSILFSFSITLFDTQIFLSQNACITLPILFYFLDCKDNFLPFLMTVP